MLCNNDGDFRFKNPIPAKNHPVEINPNPASVFSNPCISGFGGKIPSPTVGRIALFKKTIKLTRINLYLLSLCLALVTTSYRAARLPPQS